MATELSSKMRILPQFLGILILCTHAYSFQSTLFPKRTNAVVLQSTNHGDDAGSTSSNGKDALNSMRLILEQSWNSETMGEIPADADVAAKEAFETIEQAQADGVTVCFVDLLLPAYDIKQGPELYDEVLAMEYCIALSEYLDGKTQILVKDDKVRKTISRVLGAREKAAEEKAREERERAELETAKERERAAVEAAKREVEAKREAMIREQNASSEEGNEDGEDDGEPSDESEKDPSELDVFRQSLMASWDLDVDEDMEPSTDAESLTSPQDDPRLDQTVALSDFEDTPPEVVAPAIPPPYVKRYRLASLFGDCEIKQGSEMMTEVVETIRQNALPEEDEENMIILSSLSLQETVAVRSLVNKYEVQKNIILVNCKLDPLPPEVRRGQTVYSILPLIAKQRGPESDSDEKPPKVVVLRRYPRPWQVYVDVGDGFQLADSIPPTIQTKRELPMEMITESVRRFLR